jgi:hypothetical protein
MEHDIVGFNEMEVQGRASTDWRRRRRRSADMYMKTPIIVTDTN